MNSKKNNREKIDPVTNTNRKLWWNKCTKMQKKKFESTKTEIKYPVVTLIVVCQL